jgi:16S rRNA (cytosine967-C5)-methyltransferase
MAVSAARNAAFDILLRVERDDSYAAELLHSDALNKLSTRDHGLATELVMGVLRWQSLLDEKLTAASSQKLARLDLEVLVALRLGAYQLRFLSRVPARAAIFESVELVKSAQKRSAASFVNAVLRKIGLAGPEDYLGNIAKSSDAKALARNAAHPPWLVTRWVELYGLESARQICIQNQSVPTLALNINDNINDNDNDDNNAVTDAELASEGVQLSPGQLLLSARRVSAGNVTKTQAYRDGRIFIQDEASQLVALLASQGKKGSFSAADSPILDCCAAPGGKTALMARRKSRSRVFAIDLHPHRARLLQKLHRQNNILIVAADARQLPFSKSFDRILADVPCSGTGTLAHNPEIKWRLKKQDLQDFQSRQLAILQSALGQLSIGGRAVYSTCSLENEENEAVVKAALDNAPEFRVIDMRTQLEFLRQTGELVPEPAINDIGSLLAGPYLRTIPGVHSCDGFFAAMIERK